VNCKPGDMAMVVRTQAGKQTGVIVRVLGVYAGPFKIGMADPANPIPWWKVDRELIYSTRSGAKIRFAAVADRCLMPINPLDDQVEELAVADTGEKHGI
jgi:hypothetical protein